MAEKQDIPARNVQLIINIVINSVPADQVTSLKEQAYQLGDEVGAQVTINETPVRQSGA